MAQRYSEYTDSGNQWLLPLQGECPTSPFILGRCPSLSAVGLSVRYA